MVKVVSFGCRINSYESEIFKEKLQKYDNLVVVIVNNENKVDNMTKAQVNDVFRGTITDWSAIK